MSSENNMVVRTGPGYVVERAAAIQEDIPVFLKGAKMANKIIVLASECLSNLALCWLNIADSLRYAIEVIETVGFFNLVAEFIIPTDGRYFFTDPANSAQKVWEKVLLFVHSSFKLIRAISVYAVIPMAFMAKLAIGQLTYFKIALDGSYAASSFAGVLEAIRKLGCCSEKTQEAEEKIQKWKFRPLEIAAIRRGRQETLDAVSSRYVDAIAAKTASVEKNALAIADLKEQMKADHGSEEMLAAYMAKNKLIQNLEAKNEEANAKIAVLQGRLEKIAAKQFASLADELEKSKDAEAIDVKIREWEKVIEKSHNDRVSSWLKIATASTKIAVISLALTLTAINYWTWPFTLTLAAGGAFADTVGFIKIYWDHPVKKTAVAV